MRNPTYSETMAASYEDRGNDDWAFQDEYYDWEELWTDEDEAALENWEEERRTKLAEANEY